MGRDIIKNMLTALNVIEVFLPCALKTHMDGIHGSQELEVCPVCGKGYKFLPIHMKLYHTLKDGVPLKDVKEMPCLEEGCGRMFRTKQEVKEHIKRAHTMEREQCEVCQQWLKNLKTHMKQVHGEKKHSCHQCGKVFTKNCDLKLHIRRVHERKRYVCPECRTTVCKIRDHLRVSHNITNFDINTIEVIV